MSDNVKIALISIVTLPLTVLFIAWFTVLPSIGFLWMLGWLK